MPRYFIEVGYKGTQYAGFQIQENANTIQAEVEKALQIFFKFSWALTGSSRTDAGVHANQNFFHADAAIAEIPKNAVYGLNAILPHDIVLKSIMLKKEEAHSRFDALSRSYIYNVYQTKNPFKTESAYFFPYALNVDLMHAAAEMVLKYTDFSSFSKKHTQVNNNYCTILKSFWIISENELSYNVTANRFLRGMVRALVATMLQVGTGRLTLAAFEALLKEPKIAQAYFNAPAHGLYLQSVNYPLGY